MADTSSTHHDSNWNESKSFDANASLEAGRNAAMKAADLARSQLDTTQQNLHSGLTIATETAHRSISGFQEALTGDKVKEAMKKSAQHIEAISGAGAELTQGLQEISREWMAYAKLGTEKWQAEFGALARCRTPHELFEVQSRLTKENLEAFFAGARRISEVSTAVAAKATQKIAAARQTNA